MKKLYYKVIGADKIQNCLMPVEVVEGSLKRARFDRQDCIIKPIGGIGEMRVDYNKLIIK